MTGGVGTLDLGIKKSRFYAKNGDAEGEDDCVEAIFFSGLVGCYGHAYS